VRSERTSTTSRRSRSGAAETQSGPWKMRREAEGRENREMDQGMPSESTEHSHEKAPGIAPEGRVISYNVNEGERPDGIRVRFKIRIATGKRAQIIDARQAAVIMEVLQWQRQQQHL
jgi:hypothetical protein